MPTPYFKELLFSKAGAKIRHFLIPQTFFEKFFSFLILFLKKVANTKIECIFADVFKST